MMLLNGKKGIHFKQIGMLVLIICMLTTITSCGSSSQLTDNSDSANQTEDINSAESIDSSESTDSEESTDGMEGIDDAESTDSEEIIGSTENTDNSIDPDKPMIALTFDDGPNTTSTVQVLDVLEEYDVRGTFFLIGNNITANSMNSVSRAYEMGCEIGNHSKSHQDMSKLSEEEIKDEVEVVNDMIKNITGEAPKFFRPPYISTSTTMYDTIDLTFICGIGCNDWIDSVSAEERAEEMLNNAADGVIYLLHDGNDNFQTVEALKIVIPELIDQGYQFVTLTELFETKGVEIDPDDSNIYSVVN